jgi:hypothetical protein
MDHEMTTPGERRSISKRRWLLFKSEQLKIIGIHTEFVLSRPRNTSSMTTHHRKKIEETNLTSDEIMEFNNDWKKIGRYWVKCRIISSNILQIHQRFL